MDTLDKLRGKFFNKNSFNVGFNNRSPLNYITSSGPTQPTFNDTGMKSFEPDQWKGAFDSSDAVRKETKAHIDKQKGYYKAAWDGIKLLATAGMGGAAAGGGAGGATGFQQFISGADSIFSGEALQNADNFLGNINWQEKLSKKKEDKEDDKQNQEDEEKSSLCEMNPDSSFCEN